MVATTRVIVVVYLQLYLVIYAYHIRYVCMYEGCMYLCIGVCMQGWLYVSTLTHKAHLYMRVHALPS